MKKLLIILCSCILLTGCNSKTPEETESKNDILADTTSESEIDGENETETSSDVSGTDISKKEDYKRPVITDNTKRIRQKAQLIELTEKSKNDLLNSSKTVIPVYGGYYYETYIGGRDSANFVISYDSGYGNAVPINEAEDCIWKFSRDGVLYGLKYDHRNSNHDLVVVKCENQQVIPIMELDYYGYVYFTPDYIYYKVQNGDFSEFYRTDYEGGEAELVLKTDDLSEKFMVDGDRIYYDRISPGTGTVYYNEGCGIYDMKSESFIALKDGRIGRINNGYMYYLSDDNLMRMDIESYVTEFVCEAVSEFEFCGDAIFVRSILGDEDSGSIFKLVNGEKQKVFDAAGFFGNDNYYDIDAIQYEGGRIFIKISSGPYYSYIAEIDAYGNIIRKFYENNGL